MDYSPKVKEILRKYNIIQPDGSLTQVNLLRPVAKPLGAGPLLDADAISKLVAADTTPDSSWTDWILYQAAGGDPGKQMTENAMKQIETRFINERVNGYTNPKTKKYMPGVSKEEALARWQVAGPKLKEMLSVGNQDSVSNLQIFGFFRSWPGRDRIYEKVVSAVTNFLAVRDKAVQMNKDVKKDGGEQVGIDPEDYKNCDELNRATEQVKHYFASLSARQDVRLASHPSRKDSVIYDDDYVTVLVPLTWAAAVRYGYDQWAWANRDTFNSVLSKPGQEYRNEWKNRTSKGSFYVYITFNTPVPGWVSMRDRKFAMRTLRSLAVELSANDVDQDPNTWIVWDEENRNTLKISDVKAMILAEPTRKDDPEIQIPLGRVYQNQQEAEEVVKHLDAALEATAEWLKSFDRKSIQVDPLQTS